MRKMDGHVARMSRVVNVANSLGDKNMCRFFGDAGKHVLKVTQGLILVAMEARV